MSYFLFFAGILISTSSTVFAANSAAPGWMIATTEQKAPGVELAKKISTRADAIKIIKSGEDEFQALEESQKSMLITAGVVAELFKKSAVNISNLYDMASKGSLTQSQLMVAINQIQIENKANVEKYKVEYLKIHNEYLKFNVLSKSIKSKNDTLKNSIPNLQ